MRFNKLLEKKAHSNASLITVNFLRQLKIPVTATEIISTIEQHPDYPSLLSISDSLSKWKIDNMAFEVEPGKLEKLPVPFIAHTKNAGGNFISVQSVNGRVNFINEKGKTTVSDKEEFINSWSGVALVAEANENSGQTNYVLERKKELVDNFRMPAVVIICLLLAGYYAITQVGGNNPWSFLLLFLKLIGSVAAGLLLWFEVDKSNSFIQQICSAGKNTNCTAILSSKQSKLFNLISWSEIGFFYFVGGYLFLLTAVERPLSAYALLCWLNLLALPYPFFSVYYQWRIAKQWCPLCLCVQAILILEFVVAYCGFWNTTRHFNFSTTQLLPLFISFLLPVFFWMATKKNYLKTQEGKRNKKELSRLKYNKEIFNALLSKQKQIILSSEGLGITLGNPNASNTIIKVCNPYCGPCAKAHPVIDEILESNDDVKVQILFMPAVNDEKEKIIRHLLVLNETGDERLIKNALDDWYMTDTKDYETFNLKHCLNVELQSQDKRLEIMSNWCKETGITFTPTFFVNGYQLPELYKVEDLKHLL